MPDIKTAIQDLWLSENETKIYLAILKWGALNVTEIATKTQLKRTTASNYLSEMLQKWLVARNVTGKRMKYIAESPEKLLRDYDQKRESFMDSLPELNSIYRNASQKASIRYFEGKSGIMDIYREISLGFLPIYTFYSIDRFLELFKDMSAMDEFVNNVVRNENKIVDLIEDTPKARNIMKYRAKKEKKWKFLPKNFILGVDILIQWDKIAMVSFGSEMWIIIENAEIVSAQKQMFDFMWEHLD